MLSMILKIESILLKWIIFIVYIPILSWIIMLFTLMVLETHVESLCLNNGFGIWLSSLLTAYGFFLFKLMRG